MTAEILELLTERQALYDTLTDTERKDMQRRVTHASRADGRRFVSDTVEEMQLANEKGDASKVHRLARQLGENGNNRRGTKVTHSIECDVLAHCPLPAEPLPPEVAEAACAPTLREEVDRAVKWLRSGRAKGCDSVQRSTRRRRILLTL